MKLLGDYRCEDCGSQLVLDWDYVRGGFGFVCKPCERFAREHWERNYAWKAAPIPKCGYGTPNR